MNAIWPFKSGRFFRESHIFYPLQLPPFGIAPRPHPATPVPYRPLMRLRLLLAFLCLAQISACAARGPTIPPAPVPAAAEPLDPSITPLTMEQDDQVRQ